VSKQVTSGIRGISRRTAVDAATTGRGGARTGQTGRWGRPGDPSSAGQTNVRRTAVDNSQGNPQDVPLTFHRPGSVRWSFVATVAPGGWMNGRVSGGGPGTDGGRRALEPTHRRRGVGGAGPAARNLETPERAYAAGFRRLGIGALYGLSDWRLEAISVAAHAEYLLRHCWKSQLTISLPRLRPCAGDFQPLTQMTDRDMVQLACAFRLKFPDAGLVLSTREAAKLRDGLIPLGITLVSAGSHTEPGGYTGAGKENLHHTERGRIIELGASEWANAGPDPHATRQFATADDRSAQEMSELIQRLGYEPVWKDWDEALAP